MSYYWMQDMRRAHWPWVTNTVRRRAWISALRIQIEPESHDGVPAAEHELDQIMIRDWEGIPESLSWLWRQRRVLAVVHRYAGEYRWLNYGDAIVQMHMRRALTCGEFVNSVEAASMRPPQFLAKQLEGWCQMMMKLGSDDLA